MRALRETSGCAYVILPGYRMDGRIFLKPVMVVHTNGCFLGMWGPKACV